VVYQIYPRSFADSNHDGIGDLGGVRDRLGHLAWLGVDAIWLSPFYRSPMADFGYDVADYCDVDPLFGALDDIDGLIADAHALGIRVVLDWVPNHTSEQHPWFVESRSSTADPKREWYVWRDPSPSGGPPNNWRAAFSPVPAWTLDPTTGQYYLHCFLPQQPDLDWSNPRVVEAMHGVLRFWLDRGVDGVRIDVVHLLGKDPDLADDPPESIGLPHVGLNDRPETHPILRDLRRLVDGYEDDRMMVGEVYLLDVPRMAKYYGRGDELHLSFNFPALYAEWDADCWREVIDTTTGALDPIDAWPTWVLSNHDNPRHRNRYGGSESRARAAAVLLLGLRGTPFLYAGEELGLLDAEVPPDRVVDPGGRDGCRAPIPWDDSVGHGWTTDPWLPLPPESTVRNVAHLRSNPASILHLYRRLLEQRHASLALEQGDQTFLATPPGVLGWIRSTVGDDHRVILVNFTASIVELGADLDPVIAEHLVLVASDGVGEGGPAPRTLGPDQAVLLGPS